MRGSGAPVDSKFRGTKEAASLTWPHVQNPRP